MEDTSDYFNAYVEAYLAYHRRPRFHCDLVSLHVAVPSSELSPGDYYDLLHEYTHAQLGNGVLGIALNALTELCAAIEKPVFGQLENVLEHLKPSTPSPETLYYRLFVHALPRSSNEDFNLLPNTVRENVKSAWNALFESGPFREDAAAFMRLFCRRNAILEEWRLVHEGLANYSTLELCLSSDEDLEWKLGRAIDILPDSKKPSRLEKIIDTLKTLAKSELELGSAGLEPDYRKGVSLIGRAFKECGGRFSIWFAALAASHFPYYACDIVDVDEQSFAAWLTNGMLATRARLEHIVDEQDTLLSLSKEFESTKTITVEMMSAAIKLVNGSTSPQPICDSYKLFAEWERAVVWKSQLAMEHYNRYSIDPNAIGLELLAPLERDCSFDFRISNDWNPPLLLLGEKEMIAGSDGDLGRAKRRFINAYEVNRTAAIIGWLNNTICCN